LKLAFGATDACFAARERVVFAGLARSAITRSFGALVFTHRAGGTLTFAILIFEKSGGTLLARNCARSRRKGAFRAASALSLSSGIVDGSGRALSAFSHSDECSVFAHTARLAYDVT
jgi:hypothetical protein